MGNVLNRWERHLEGHSSSLRQIADKMKKEEGKLRFNDSFVKASDVAEQYFCEKKIEMERVHGKIETERRILGTKSHEKLLEGSVEVKRKDFWKDIYGNKPVLAPEMLLIATYKGLILAGRPDSVLFLKGLPLVVFEYKFSKSQRPFRNHHVQARTYCILLKKMGFDARRLVYALAMVNPTTKVDEELRRRVYEVVMTNGLKESVLKTEDTRIYIAKFNQEQAEQDLDWALEFWRNEREAIPTRNPNKCRSCEYNEKCDGFHSVDTREM